MLSSGKIIFDAEDRPPPSYYGQSDSPPPTPRLEPKEPVSATSKLDKSEWWKAPEFVPRAVVSQPLPSVSPPFPTFASSPQPTFLPALLPPHVLPFPPLRHSFLPGMPGLLPPLLNLPRQGERTPLGRLPIKFNPLLQARPSLRPLGPNNATTSFPAGYTANVTSITSGMGHQIPAIVLKKKRKKRNRKNRGKNAAPDAENGADEKSQASPEDPKMDEEEEPSLAEDDEETSSLGDVRRRSEADLTKLDEGEGGGDGDSYELLQSAIESGTLTMLHGSCPDLSTAQRGLLDELLWDMEEEAAPTSSAAPVPCQLGNPFDRQPPPFDYNDASDTDTEVVMARMQRSLQGATSHLAPITVVDPDSDYELSSAPVFSAIESAFSQGRITSAAVKALDREVEAEMRQTHRILAQSVLHDNLDQADQGDQIFERVSRDRERASRERDNPGLGSKSLMEEMEEKELLWAEKGPVSFAAVHKGGQSQTVPIGEDHPLAEKFVRKTAEDLFGNGDPMRITVNAFEDPEELVVDEASSGASGRLERLRSALKARLNASGYRPHQTRLVGGEGGEYRANGYLYSGGLRRPDAAVCCSLM